MPTRADGLLKSRNSMRGSCHWSRGITFPSPTEPRYRDPTPQNSKDDVNGQKYVARSSQASDERQEATFTYLRTLLILVLHVCLSLALGLHSPHSNNNLAFIKYGLDPIFSQMIIFGSIAIHQFSIYQVWPGSDLHADYHLRIRIHVHLLFLCSSPLFGQTHPLASGRHHLWLWHPRLSQ